MHHTSRQNKTKMAERSDGMPIRLSKIDALFLPHHRYLEAGDECYYWGEYQVHQGYSAGPTNQLISNLKISPAHRASRRYFYKEQAIASIGHALRGPLVAGNEAPRTVVPIPPSKTRDHQEYDDRMMQIARLMVAGTGSEAREIVQQRESYQASHTVPAADRVTLETLLQNYEIAPDEARPHETVLILDDVLTQGKHFRAVKMKIRDRFPQVRIMGLFVARAVDRAVVDDFEIL